MTTVFIVRHAEVEYPHDEEGRRLMYPPEAHISEEGGNQLAALAQGLKDQGVKLDVIETSGLARCVESAKVLAGVLGTERVTVNSAFNDSHIPGWIGVPLSEQQKLMNKREDIYMNPRSADQESYEGIAKRVVAGFHDLVERNRRKVIGLVSHGDPIRLLMYRLINPEGTIPNMSILSKENYLKRGETFRAVVDNEGKLLETELISNIEGFQGRRERYVDKA